MIDVIRDVLKKEPITYVFKEYIVKNDLGWYWISYRTDNKIYTFSCWFNDTSIGKTPFELATRELDLDSITIFSIGNVQEVKMYKSISNKKLLKKEHLKNIESNFKNIIINNLDFYFKNKQPFIIGINVSFNPVLLLIFKIHSTNGRFLGHIIFNNNSFTVVGVYRQQLLICKKLLEEVITNDTRFHKFYITKYS